MKKRTNRGGLAALSMLLILMNVGGSTGCQGSTENGPCTLEFVYGLNVTVQDENGDAILEATVTATEGDYSEVLEDRGDGSYVGAGERAGSYSIMVEMSGYKSASATASVTEGRCHVISESVTITMTPL